eukprot:TRINITY_DN8222_c0_g1_i1.p1 TRINITY_DN8222_c0_g1~~TRINITY_DN8222_c0_g1_i1.p1  ORF type:complete len:1135 (-),score=141.75 TRINITY_DN8222_c0_g1_i1:182-3586(-)
MAGTSTVVVWQCGKEHMTVIQDEVSFKEAQTCMPWCHERMQMFVSVYSFWKVIRWQSNQSVARIATDFFGRTYQASTCFGDSGFWPNIEPRAGGVCEKEGNLDRVEYDWMYSNSFAHEKGELWSRTMSRTRVIFQNMQDFSSFYPSMPWARLVSNLCIPVVHFALNILVVPFIVVFRIFLALLMALELIVGIVWHILLWGVGAIAALVMIVLDGVWTTLLTILQTRVGSFQPNVLSWSWSWIFSSLFMQGKPCGDVSWVLNWIYVPLVLIFRVVMALLMAIGFVALPIACFLLQVLFWFAACIWRVLTLHLDQMWSMLLNLLDSILALFTMLSSYTSLFPGFFLRTFVGQGLHWGWGDSSPAAYPRKWLVDCFWSLQAFTNPPAEWWRVVGYEFLSMFVFLGWLFRLIFFAVLLAAAFLLGLMILAGLTFIGVGLFGLFIVPEAVGLLPLLVVQLVWLAGMVIQSIAWAVLMAVSLPILPIYLYAHYLMEGEGAIHCMRIIAGYNFGNLPKSAGPVGGVAVLVLGFALTMLKKFATTPVKIQPYEIKTLKSKLAEVAENLVRSDRNTLVYVSAEFSEFFAERVFSHLRFGFIPIYTNAQGKTQGQTTFYPGSRQQLLDQCEQFKLTDSEVATTRLAYLKAGEQAMVTIKTGKKLEALTLYFRPELKAEYVADRGEDNAKNQCMKTLAEIDRVRKSVINSMKAVLPCTDNYSDMSQSVNFLSKGQPFYFAYNVLGILWNVICGLWYNPPNYDSFWTGVDIVGRIVQADVMEAAQQNIRTGHQTRLYLEKVTIQAATENLINMIMTITALLHLDFIDASKMLPSVGDFAERFGIDRVLAEFVVCFLLSSGNVGLISSFCLSCSNLQSGIGEYPQWMEHYEGVSSGGQRALTSNYLPFKPDPYISRMRFCETLSVCITLVVLTFCVPYKWLYLAMVLLSLVSFGPLAFSEPDPVCKCSGMAFMAIFWVFHPFMYIWPHLVFPFGKALSQKPFQIMAFYAIRCLCLYAAWFFITKDCRDLIPVDIEMLISTSEKLVALPGQISWKKWIEIHGIAVSFPSFADVVAPMRFQDIVPLVNTVIVMTGALCSLFLPLLVLCVMSNRHMSSDEGKQAIAVPEAEASKEEEESLRDGMQPGEYD